VEVEGLLTYPLANHESSTIFFHLSIFFKIRRPPSPVSHHPDFVSLVISI